MEMLGIRDTLMVCKALKISEELAYQYHSYDPEDHSFYMQKIFDFKNMKVVNPNLAKAILKNVKFQSLAAGDSKVEVTIFSQDLEIIKNCFDGLGLNHNSHFYGSPLHIACDYGQLDVVKLLINEYGVDVFGARNSYEICCSGCVDIVKFFFSHPNANDDHYFSALIAAAEEGQPDIIRLLRSK
jgi:ankyrin repeat protein